ncbi:MAG: hypothetical protein FVQ80_05970 [Planctomycetes bacterium]|nr:hypothetical protein [Planctomycetota bacterium]
MKYKNIINLNLGLLLIILTISSGCAEYVLPVRIFPVDLSGMQQNDTPNESMGKRFDEAALSGPTAVESAIELSKKYATLSEETTKLKNENDMLNRENNSIKDQLNNSRAQLTQTQKELEQANDLLIEMRIELNGWKTDIIGFRQEMREADRAQLETLLKLLKILGGEIKNEVAETQNPDPLTISKDDKIIKNIQTQ